MAQIPDERLQAVYNRYLAHREAEARYHRMEVIFGTTVAFVIVALVVASYFTVRANFSGKQLSVRLSQEISALAPEINHAMLEVGEDVMPVYLEQAEVKLRDALPEVEHELSQEIEGLWGDVGDHVQKDFHDALERSARRLEARLRDHFPDLLDEAGLALLETELAEMLEEDTADFLERFFDGYSRDLNKVYRTVEGFRPNRFERLDEVELAAQYIHLWLTLLDREILGLD